MMAILSTIYFTFETITLTLAISIFVAGFKSSMLHDGPSPFELTAMLWRGEIKSKKVRR